VTINPVNDFINGRANYKTINVKHTKIFVSVHGPDAKMIKYSPFVYSYEHDFVLAKNTYTPGQHFILVYYETWANVPDSVREYTVRTYAKDGLDIYNHATGKKKMIRKDVTPFTETV